MELNDPVRDHLTAGSHINKKNIVIGNFLGGLAWGVGSVVGATVVIALLAGALRGLGVFDPIVELLRQLPQGSQFYK